MTKTYFPSEKNRQIVRDYLTSQPGWVYKSQAMTALRDSRLLSWSSAYKTIATLIEEGEIEVDIRPNLSSSSSPHAGGPIHFIRLKQVKQ